MEKYQPVPFAYNRSKHHLIDDLNLVLHVDCHQSFDSKIQFRKKRIC